MKPVGAALLVAAWVCLGPMGSVRAESPPAEERAPSAPPAAALPAKAEAAQPALNDSATAPAAPPAQAETGSTASPVTAGPDSAAAVSPAGATHTPAPAHASPPPARRKTRSVRPAAPRANDAPAAASPPVPALATRNTPPPPAVEAVADGSEAERVAREIARTAMWLNRAASQVPRSQNAKAAGLLASAQGFQLDARDAYEVRQFARAQRLTQAARDYADRAVRLAGPATDDPEYVKTVVKRTDDALDRLKDYLDAGGTPAAHREYADLKEEQKKARGLLEEGKARDAYRATTSVRDGVLAVLRVAPPVHVRCESAKKAVENADGSREKVREDIGRNVDAVTARYLASADAQLAKAHALLARGSCRDAVLRAKAAERQMEKAIDASRAGKKKGQ